MPESLIFPIKNRHGVSNDRFGFIGLTGNKMSKIVKVRSVNDYGRYLGCRRCVIMSNLALPKTGCTSAESKQGGLRRSPSVSAMPKRGNGLAWSSTYSGLWLCSRFALSLLRCFGFIENRLHLGQKQCKWKAETKLVLAMLRRSLRSLESKLKPVGLVRISVCTVFRDSNSVTKPALAAKQQQYAPSFSLSVPCVLLTLTHRLRFISNHYFDTPSVIDGRCHREMLA